MKKLYLSLFICLSTYNLSIAQCTPNFIASSNPICVGDEVYYTNLTTGTILSYDWNFGAGATPATFVGENPPNITYSSSGTKSVSLTITCFDAITQTCTGTTTNFPGGSFTFSTCVPVPGGGIIVTSTRTTSITVKDMPAPTFTSTAPACAGEVVDFTYTGSADVANTYSWNFGAGASPSTSNVQNPTGIIYSTDGAKNVTLTVSNGACEGSTSSSITINPTPTSGIASSAPACMGEDVSFASTGTGTSWSWNFGTNGSAVAPSTTTSENPTASYTSFGPKTVTLTNTIGTCSTDASTVIMVYETPTSTFTSTAPACTKEAVDFTNTGSTGSSWRYLWDFGAGATPSTSSAENPTGVVYSTDGTKTVSLTVFDSRCSSTSTNTITINLSPTASFTSTAPACTKTPVDFFNTGTTGATYAWNFGGNATPGTGNTEDVLGVSFALAGAETVTLTTTANGCSDTFTDRIAIFQSPIASFDGPSSVCVGVRFDMSNTGSSGIGTADTNWVYTWDFGAGAIAWGATSENPGSIYYTTAGTKVVTLTVANQNCSTTLTKVITALATPVADFASTEPQCTDLPVDFINMGSNTGVSWSWNFDASASTNNVTTEDAPGILFSSPGKKIVQFIITNTTSSCKDTSTQAITIHQNPTASFTSTAPQCVGDPVGFTNTGSTGSSGTTNGEWAYSWDFGEDANPQFSTSENPLGIAFGTGGNKVVTFTVFNGYCTETSTQTIVINNLPVVNAGRDTTICANTTVQIGSGAIAGNTYSWFAPVTLSSASVSNPVATPVAHITDYILTVTDGNGCIDIDTITVTMLDPIDVFAGVDEEICRFDSVQIGVGLVEQQLYLWSPAAGLSSITSPNPTASPDSTTTYRVTVLYNGKACKAETDEVTITVHQLPYIEAGTVNKQPSPNDSITIVDSMTVGSSLQLIAIGGLQYSWDPPYSLDNVGIFNPFATPDSTTSYIVTGIDIYGCINTDTVTVIVLAPSFWVPTAFTPDGNGENDVFYVRGEGIQDFELGIFNRWGEQIFLSKAIETGWDGTRPITGEKLPAGAYVYYIKGNLTDGSPVDAKGLINLLR